MPDITYVSALILVELYICSHAICYFSRAGMQLSGTASSTTSRYTPTGPSLLINFSVFLFSGCQRFAPPDGGGFVCLNSEDTIYCSVQCDNTTEFSATPINPYRCGPATRFLWMDFTEEIYKELPQCDGKHWECPILSSSITEITNVFFITPGFRHSRRPIFPESYYLPAPCNHLTDVQENEKFRDLLIELQFIYGCSDCSIAQAYVKCPPAFAT